MKYTALLLADPSCCLLGHAAGRRCPQARHPQLFHDWYMAVVKAKPLEPLLLLVKPRR